MHAQVKNSAQELAKVLGRDQAIAFAEKQMERFQNPDGFSGVELTMFWREVIVCLLGAKP